MPLSCDCYGGCWGDHSKNWPDIAYTEERLAYLNSQSKLHGSYVVCQTPESYKAREKNDTKNTRIRVETYAILMDVLQATESPPPASKPEPSPTVSPPDEPASEDPNRLSLDNYQRMY